MMTEKSGKEVDNEDNDRGSSECNLSQHTLSLLCSVNASSLKYFEDDLDCANLAPTFLSYY